MVKISVILITKNAEATIAKTLASISGWVDEIIIADDRSTDKTLKIAKKYKATIYKFPEIYEGKQRIFALSKAHGQWILSLDSDEIVTPELKKEIIEILNKNEPNINGYIIPFLNFFYGKPLRHGGENYSKLILLKRENIKVQAQNIHTEYKLTNGETKECKNYIYHFSYLSISQVFKKFTFYALRQAKDKKEKGEKSSLWKIITYPPHMFWSRYISSEGFKDGFPRVFLDLAFWYLELLTYILLFFL